MNDHQRAHHDSHLAIRLVCNQPAHRALWSSLPAYVVLYDRFLAKIALVNACILVQGADRTGVTAAKIEAREKLEATALEVAGALGALAFLRGDADLASQVNVTPTDLNRLPDAEIDDRAQAFLDLATNLLAPAAGSANNPNPTTTAADVGLTEGKLDLLETRIETYNLLLGSPRAARGEKSAATANLATALDDIRDILERGLDRLMRSYRGTDFFTQYQSARRLTDPATPSAPAPTNPPAA